MHSKRVGNEKINLVGAGLVGSLLSIFLARRGHTVELFERRPDMRVERISAGRSINLAVSTRGLHALKQLGLEAETLKQAVPMRGRMIHSPKGELTFQPYGLDETQCINSISRGDLNKMLMTEAERTGRVKIHFNRRVERLSEFAESEIVIGTDGSASAIRAELMAKPGHSETQSQLDYGYKELHIPAGPGGSFRLERNALHIWPRGTFMLIALPNHDGSYTCTLFLPFEGPISFARLKTPADVREFFLEHFADAVPLMPELEETYFANPTGQMVTVKCAPWNLEGRALLVGDAAHAIVPFFGQGMNCGFEDCTVLDECFDRYSDWPTLFSEFSRMRKSHADAIADMAVENFAEMRDKVGNAAFLMEKAVEKILQTRFPNEFRSRYALVTFSRVPYRLASDVGLVTDRILAELCAGLTSAEAVDLRKAEILIRERVAPMLRGYV